jgi:hypothetical protein
LFFFLTLLSSLNHSINNRRRICLTDPSGEFPITAVFNQSMPLPPFDYNLSNARGAEAAILVYWHRLAPAMAPSSSELAAALAIGGFGIVFWTRMSATAKTEGSSEANEGGNTVADVKKKHTAAIAAELSKKGKFLKAKVQKQIRHGPKPLKKWERQDAESLVLGRKHKWLGGAVGADGCVYGIPSHAAGVIKIVPRSHLNQPDEFSVISEGTPLGHGWFKWLRGVVVPADDDAIYGIPAAAGSVLRIDTKNGSVSTHGQFQGAPWSWHGGVLAGDGNVYAIPSCAEQVWSSPRPHHQSPLDPRLKNSLDP